MSYCSLSLSKTPPPKQPEEERVYFILYFISPIRGRQGRHSSQAGTAAEAMEESCYQLAPHGLLSLLSYMVQDHQPRGSTSYRELGPPTPQSSRKQCLTEISLMEEVS